MALAFTGKNFFATSGSVATSGITAGNSLVVVVFGPTTRTFSGVTDNQGNTYALATSYDGGTAKLYFYLANAVVPPTSVTASVSGTGQYRVTVIEVSGGAIQFDVGPGGNTATTAPATGSVTPSASTLAVAAYYSPNMNGTLTGVAAGWTDLYSDANNATYAVARAAVTAGAATSCSWTGTHLGASFSAAIMVVTYAVASKSSSDSTTENLASTGVVQATTLSSTSQTQTLAATTNVGIPVSSSTSQTQALTESVAAIQVSTTTLQTQALTETSQTTANLSSFTSQTQATTQATQTTAQVPSTDSLAPRLVESTLLDVGPGSYHKRLRVDLIDWKTLHRVGSGPIVHVESASYSYNMDKIGTFEFTMPATEEAAASVVTGRMIMLYREGEGNLFRGYVRETDVQVTPDGGAVLSVVGDSAFRRTVWRNTGVFNNYTATNVNTVVGNLMFASGWGIRTLDDPAAEVTASFNAATVFDAVMKVAQQLGWHVREDNILEEIDAGVFGENSGIVLQNVAQANPNLSVVPISNLTIKRTENSLWNRIYPLGAGEGINALTLKYSTRTTPYEIGWTLSWDNVTKQYYVEDAVSQGLYDVRETWVQFPDVAPISNSDAEIVNAANVLYDLAVAMLQYSKDPAETYVVQCTGLTQLNADGSTRLQPGNKVRLVYHGIVKDQYGRRSYVDVDKDFYVLGYSRSFDATGADAWTLTISTSSDTGNGPEATIAKTLGNIWAIQTAMKPSTYREIHGPSKRSVDATHPTSVKVTYDSMVTYMHKAILDVQVLPVVSNTQAASGGGGGTSSGGSSHSHAITATATNADSAPHKHLFAQSLPTNPWPGSSAGGWNGVTGDPAYFQQLQVEDETGNAFGFFVGRGDTQLSPIYLYTWDAGITTHSHPISGQTSQSESSHTHPLPTHTHALTYGIFQGPSPSNAQIHVLINNVDVTTALGGPWNNDFDVDVTPYLVDATGKILRTTTTIQVKTNAAAVHDVEITLRSLVTALSVVPT